MTQRRSFLRKVGYITAIILLLLPMSWLSEPSSGGRPGRESPGGRLAQLRKEHRLSQANLGEIDPASETMKLATLGMRGIAVNILWDKANHYKKTEDWTNLSATLEQITKLQPNFISVWQFLGWNLSYNVSVEFDDYRDRYYWVIRGINFLKNGLQYNEDDPRLLWDVGWFTGQKIGRADEEKQFRRLFKNDDDFHPADLPRDQRDNWLVAKEWFHKVQDAVQQKGKIMKGKNPLIYNSDPAMAQISYSEAIEKEGVFGEVAKLAWKRAAEDWYDFGALPILATPGFHLHLNDLERKRQEIDKHQQALEDVAARQDEDPEAAQKAERLTQLLAQAQHQAEFIENYRNIVNFNYWRMRCEFEQTEDALTARELIYQAEQARRDADLVRAKDLYNEALVKWRAVLDRFPTLVGEMHTGEELVETIVSYRKVLEELDEPFPTDFILRDVVEENDREGLLTDVVPPRGAEPDRPQAKEDQPPATED